MATRMEATLAALADRVGNTDSREYHVSKALLLGYEMRWGGSKWTALAVEESFDVPIINPQNLSEHQYRLVGMLDTRVEGYGYTNVMLEHKTTKTDFTRADTYYFDKLPHDQQLSIYSLAAIANGNPLEGTIYDVIRRPSIRAKRVPFGSAAAVAENGEIGTVAEIVCNGTYMGYTVSDETEKYVTDNSDKTFKENNELFGIRVLYNCLTTPDNYYHRTDLITRRNEYLLEEVVPSLWHIAEDIAEARKEGNLAQFYQNSGSCYSFSTPCEFLALCQGASEIDDDHQWESRQGGSVSGDGRLSTSSISCWMLCRRKYFYRYVKKIQRRGRIEPVATSLGSLVHTGLEAWWSYTNERNSNGELASTDPQRSGRETQ